MTGKDLFVIMYCTTWMVLELLFVMVCWATKCLSMGDVVAICNVAFLSATSLMVFVKPIRKFVDEKIISKL